MNQDELQQPEGFRDRVSTVTETGSRKWIYALKPSGDFYKYRNFLSYFYVAIFFIMPFIQVKGMPLLMFNFPAGKFVIFSKIFWPNDFFIFAIATITLVVFIVLFTVIYGRLFCGWVCPQTVFMEFIFRKIEWLIEGTPSQQKARDNGEWNTDKILRKGLKHTLFLSFAFLIANTFLSYIFGLDDLIRIIREPLTDHIGLFSGVLIFTFLFYGVFAFVREIVCTTICPYGRFQGVLFDKDTVQIAYDYQRGEPRGKMTKNVERSLGDCIDCKKCVQVCPTGIDIRDGLQLECVACTACIDACDEVMEKVHLPKGLIRYASENQISQKTGFVFNNRMKAYTALLLGLITLMSILVGTRRSVDTYISRVNGQLFQETEDKKGLSNLYRAKIINKTRSEIPVTLHLKDKKGRIKLVGADAIHLKKEAITEVTFFIEIDKSEIQKRNTDIEVNVIDDKGEELQEVKSTFIGPFS